MLDLLWLEDRLNHKLISTLLLLRPESSELAFDVVWKVKNQVEKLLRLKFSWQLFIWHVINWFLNQVCFQFSFGYHNLYSMLMSNQFTFILSLLVTSSLAIGSGFNFIQILTSCLKLTWLALSILYSFIFTLYSLYPFYIHFYSLNIHFYSLNIFTYIHFIFTYFHFIFTYIHIRWIL